MFVQNKQKPNKSNKSTYSTSNNGISEAEKRKITKKAHIKALKINQKAAAQENKKMSTAKKQEKGIWGAVAGALAFIEGLGKVCGATVVPAVPALIGLGVVIVAASIGYIWFIS